jgi:acyl-CoA thioesterase I
MEKKICIFGASSTWGAWDPEKGGWVNRLRLYLESQDSYFELYNLGVSGDTTNEILKRFDVEAEARKPDILIFSIGDNDAVYIKSQDKHLVPLQKYEENVQILIDKSKKFTDKIFLLGSKGVDESKTTPIPWEKDYSYKNEDLMAYNKKTKEIAEKNGIHFLDFFGSLNNEDFDDGLHPNSKGHQKLFLKTKELLSNEL